LIEVRPLLFVGDQGDAESIHSDQSWAVVHACKEPYHRQALGYTGRAAPKDHPEYLVARRENALILNLVDVDDPAYVRVEIVDAAIEFMNSRKDVRVLVHCNQGRSRSPTLAMLADAASLPEKFDEAEEAFRAKYASYNPARGMREFARANWAKYRGGCIG